MGVMVANYHLTVCFSGVHTGHEAVEEIETSLSKMKEIHVNIL